MFTFWYLWLECSVLAYVPCQHPSLALQTLHHCLQGIEWGAGASSGRLRCWKSVEHQNRDCLRSGNRHFEMEVYSISFCFVASKLLPSSFFARRLGVTWHSWALLYCEGSVRGCRACFARLLAGERRSRKKNSTSSRTQRSNPTSYLYYLLRLDDGIKPTPCSHPHWDFDCQHLQRALLPVLNGLINVAPAW